MLKPKLRKNSKNKFSWGDVISEGVSQLIGELLFWILLAVLTAFPLVITGLLITYGLVWLIVPFIVLFALLIRSIYKRMQRN